MENAKTPDPGGAQEVPPGRSGRGPAPGIGVVLLTVFLDMVGFSILFPIFPRMLEHYLALEGADSAIGRLVAWLGGLAGEDVNAVDALFGGVLGSVYSLLQFLFAPVWGGLSDRVGRRPTLLVTLTGTCLGYVLWIFSGSFWLLVLSRLISGMCSGNISTASAVVADVTEGKDRARGMGLLGMMIGLGFILGPGVCLLALKLDPFGGPVGSSGLSLNPFSSPALLSTLLAASNLLWVAARFRETLPRERRGTSKHARVLNPLAQAKRLRFPGFSRTNHISFLYLAAFSGMEFTLTFLAAERLGWGPERLGVLLSYAGLVIAVVQGGFVRRMVPRLGERRVAQLGLLLLVPSFAIVGWARSALALYVGITFMAVGSALAMPSLSSLVSRYVPGDRQGLALGTNRSMQALARAVGPIVASALYWKLGSGASYYFGALFLLWPIFLALGLPPVPGHEVPDS